MTVIYVPHTYLRWTAVYPEEQGQSVKQLSQQKDRCACW